jgi:hypothetical protein
VKILTGQPRLLVVHGSSAGRNWPGVLQAKIDRLPRGTSVEVVAVTDEQSDLACCLDPRTRQHREGWQRLADILATSGARPAVVLAQQTLRGVAEIDGVDDADATGRGADLLEAYVDELVEAGAEQVFLGMSAHDPAREPQAGNERLAVIELMRRGCEAASFGPDVWTPTQAVCPGAYKTTKQTHGPGLNEYGDEMVAQHWFQQLHDHDGEDVPAWSREQLAEAIWNAMKGT